MFDEFARCRLALYGAIFFAFMGFGGRITGIEPLNNQQIGRASCRERVWY